jgi:hypothetical protein
MSERINIYKNPLDNIKNPAIAKALPLMSLHVTNAQTLLFSDNARFLGAERGQDFSVYDFETGESYRYSVTQPLVGILSWMDGHRYFGKSDGQVFVMDYDSTNRQLLTPTAESFGGMFSRDYKHILVIAPVTHSTTLVLQDVDMRAGTDLPKK